VNAEELYLVAGQVIILEDDPTLRMLMVEMLAEIGLDSAAFRTADDALMHLLETHEICPLVIADQGLPGQLQGAEFIEIVKEKWPSIASILTSGSELEPATVPSSTIYLQKPWSMNSLIDVVTGLLQQGHSDRKT
jgi:DNA-binding NtrC family response regulator